MTLQLASHGPGLSADLFEHQNIVLSPLEILETHHI